MKKISNPKQNRTSSNLVRAVSQQALAGVSGGDIVNARVPQLGGVVTPLDGVVTRISQGGEVTRIPE
jgi:hypothetical protein